MLSLSFRYQSWDSNQKSIKLPDLPTKNYISSLVFLSSFFGASSICIPAICIAVLGNQTVRHKICRQRTRRCHLGFSSTSLPSSHIIFWKHGEVRWRPWRSNSESNGEKLGEAKQNAIFMFPSPMWRGKYRERETKSEEPQTQTNKVKAWARQLLALLPPLFFPFHHPGPNCPPPTDMSHAVNVSQAGQGGMGAYVHPYSAKGSMQVVLQA